ncbi:Serine/threonine-protein kinase PknD [Planctomycetes bacterium Pla163]|uniref:Serine/threonine-protein kinase PknD n=1 Tax=Rohdeia mirabilis TaxID=2528008 RepID=A0A518CZL4_9BACT|nr:Serine/threonine-protein kinase PknD [Planctomycetes bacterium Pla163]
MSRDAEPDAFEDAPLDGEAEELFARWLESVDAGRPVELESLAGGRADLLEALRGLEAFWSQLEAAGGVDAAVDGGDGRSDRAAPGARDGGRPPALGAVVDGVHEPGRYRVHHEVGRGGMGVVFEVEDEHLHRRLAMKVVRAIPGPAGDRALTRFLDEAQVTAQLEHPAIVPVHELGRDDEGRAYFTMALVEGETFTAVVDHLHSGDEQWSLPRVLDVLVKVAEAVAYAHSRGVVHRDLKPDNIMVGSFGRVFVMDWGLAQVKSKRTSDHRRSVDSADVDLVDRERAFETGASQRLEDREPAGTGVTGSVRSDRVGAGAANADPRDGGALETDQPFLTHDGDVVGTPAYMPPEQAFGQLDRQGPRCDVYALGAILYHVLSGRPPYSDRQEGTLAALRHGGPTPLLASDAKHSRELVAICELAMRRDASKRYADVSAFVADLRAFLEGRVVDAYESGAIATARKWVLRHRALAVLAAGLVVALLSFGTTAFARFRSEQLAGRFMDLERLDDLEREAHVLWPAAPERADDLRAFLERGAEHAARLDAARAELEREESRSGAAAVDSTDGWILGKRRALVERLEAFAAPGTGTLDRVRRRLARADALAHLRERAAGAPGAQDDLRELPAGPDGLRRFEHLPTASLARLEGLVAGDDRGGRSERGLELVLLDPSRHTQLAGDLHPIDVAAGLDAEAVGAFLIATTEMTRDHWARLSEEDVHGDLPITGVSFERALEVLEHGGLTLPTKYQWLVAARGGAAGPQWFEIDPSWLDADGFVALDPTSLEAVFMECEVLSRAGELLPGPAPVASRRPNAFGLYDTLGNVRELLLDPFHRSDQRVRDYDPERWHDVRGLTRSATEQFFRLRPANDEDRILLQFGIVGEVGEATVEPYLGLRPSTVLAHW